jgi:hypothetical protein
MYVPTTGDPSGPVINVHVKIYEYIYIYTFIFYVPTTGDPSGPVTFDADNLPPLLGSDTTSYSTSSPSDMYKRYKRLTIKGLGVLMMMIIMFTEDYNMEKGYTRD